MNNKQTLVVIGNGMVGQNFLENLVASDIRDNFNVVTFCEEPHLAYDRVHLSEYFDGKTVDDLSLTTPGFFEDNKASLKTITSPYTLAIKRLRLTVIKNRSFRRKVKRSTMTNWCWQQDQKPLYHLFPGMIENSVFLTELSMT